MGQVAVIYRIMPEDTDVNLEGLKKSIEDIIPESGKLNEIKEVPIAFGLKALDVTLIFDDKKGGGEGMEDSFKGIEGIQSVEITHTGLL